VKYTSYFDYPLRPPPCATIEELAWTQKIIKWGDGIDLTTASKGDLREYVNTIIYIHLLEGFSDSTLWTLFREEFEG
jgi:hypothetical protein